MLETLINGALVGALYGLYGLGLSLCLGLMRQINLAHGDFIIFSAFIALQLMTHFGIHPLLALPIVAPIMFVVGWLLQRFVMERTLGRGEMPPILVSFGLSVILQNVMLELFSADTKSLDPGALGTAAVNLGSVAIGVLPLLTLAVAVGIFALTAAVFGSTRFGRAVRATSDNEAVAQLMGIRTRRVFANAMGAALAISAIAAIFYGMRGTFDPSTGPERMLFAFEAVILGGLGSIWGTLAGGIILGIAQASGTLIIPSLGPLVGHIVFLIGLLLMPGGLFTKRIRA
ncbi:branched-chain amino acid ABC transporter permease [Rhizobium sp. SG570]|jgi:branched-chain amino acid transport system permease protein|uniref:branched-chain amino acid ABC transporter permease n=1 Tax=Rhizobium sp. SG570 TaxID=2587113 RepID=UPI001444D32F|nr:branched-chain amino acid ABC transporter permease [Rhizobium sp. SG570]NKJ37455.1 branched-chain amino acid transport system permease protein [Rhizobium sp. SG570]NRP89139.1 High-affinity branched-chain amino acid transport system permease protein LivH [Ensifer adhaerens]